MRLLTSLVLGGKAWYEATDRAGSESGTRLLTELVLRGKAWVQCY